MVIADFAKSQHNAAVTHSLLCDEHVHVQMSSPAVLLRGSSPALVSAKARTGGVRDGLGGENVNVTRPCASSFSLFLRMGRVQEEQGGQRPTEKKDPVSHSSGTATQKRGFLEDSL